MSTEIGSSLNFGDREHTFRATEVWQELVLCFRVSMPRCKHRLKMRWFDDSFTGREAAEWLHAHLEMKGSFRDVSREQAIKLLDKFMSSDVIMEVRGKLVHFSEDPSYLYKFVTEPGPFNFIEDLTPARPLSPTSKRERASSLYVDSESGACFTNPYAFMRCEEEGTENEGVITGVSSLKRSRSDGMLSKQLAPRDENTQENRELSPYQIATVWKEVTLSRLLRLVELPALDGVLDHNAVDGKEILSNASLSGRGLLDRAAARFRFSLRRDKKPPLPPSHGLTTTHQHHKHRFSTKAKGESQSQPQSEAASDAPQWVALAMNCLSKWPDACTEELVGGLPVYSGFELDVLQSLIQYHHGLPEPLISVKLFDLFMAVNNLVVGNKPGAVDALRLCTLLLPQLDRSKLHRMLRFINKTSSNSQVVICRGRKNLEELLEYFTSVVLRSCSMLRRVGAEERSRVGRLLTFMAQNYQQIFKVPEDLKKDVQKRLNAILSGKEDFVPQVSGGSCSRLPAQEYQTAGVRSSHDALLELLDTIIADQSMNSRDKEQKLRDFQTAYPTIYSQRLPLDTPTPSKSARPVRKPRRHTSLSFSMNASTRSSPSHPLKEKSDSSETLNAVVLR